MPGLWAGLWVGPEISKGVGLWGISLRSGVTRGMVRWRGPSCCLAAPGQKSFSKAGSVLPGGCDALGLRVLLPLRNSFIQKLPQQGRACQALPAAAQGPFLSVHGKLHGAGIGRGPLVTEHIFIKHLLCAGHRGRVQ